MTVFEKLKTIKKRMQKIDIREQERKVLFDVFKKIKNEQKDFRFILVVDTETLPIFSSLVNTTELTDYKIVLTERYDLVREPFPAYQAIYLLNPNVDITNFINDMSGSSPRYAAAHLLFTYRCPPATEQAIMNKKDVVDRIQTYMDLWVQFKPLEPSVFLTPCSNAYNSLYSPTPKQSFLLVAPQMIRGLISFFLTIKAFPNIAFPKDNKQMESFARQITDEFNSVVKDLDRPESINKNNTLLILFPRGMDKIIPLLHRFTYQAMIYENFNVENETITLKEGDPDTLLSLSPYEDQIFAESMYTHFTDFKSIADRAKSFASIRDIVTNKSIDKSSPQYKKALKQYISSSSEMSHAQNHFDVVVYLDEQQDKRQLINVSTYEQQLASGTKVDDGVRTSYSPKFNDLQQQCVLNGPDPFDKLRVMATYVNTGGSLKPNEITRLLEVSNIEPKWKAAIDNMSLLPKPVKRKSSMDPGEDNPYNTDVYFPYAAKVALDAIDKLDKDVWVAPQHSGRYQNIVIFFVGGVSYGELEKLELVRLRNKSVKFFVGATNTVTPKQFLAQTRILKESA